MNNFQAVMLGLIQGIAEAFPISSSAHLRLYKFFFNVENSPFIFDILLHIATLVSICIIFRKKIIELIFSFFHYTTGKVQENDTKNMNLILTMIIATIITAIVGFSLKDFTKNLKIGKDIIGIVAIIIGFVITSTMLFASKKLRIKKKPNILITSILLGLFQGIAVLPGISRSGMTISILLILNFLEEEACQTSFILSIPSVLGALLLELRKSALDIHSIGTTPLALGMLVAFVTSLVSFSILLVIIKNKKFYLFAFYLLPLAIILSGAMS